MIFKKSDKAKNKKANEQKQDKNSLNEQDTKSKVGNSVVTDSKLSPATSLAQSKTATQNHSQSKIKQDTSVDAAQASNKVIVEKATKVEANKEPQPRVAYILCPRCEINYILSTDENCVVCKAEMGLVDRNSILLPEFDEVGEDKICPMCNVNYILEDEDVCFLCAKEKSGKTVADTEEDWSKDITDLDDAVSEEEIEISLTELEEEEDDINEESERLKNIDDFEYVNPDDYDYDEEDDESIEYEDNYVK